MQATEFQTVSVIHGWSFPSASVTGAKQPKVAAALPRREYTKWEMSESAAVSRPAAPLAHGCRGRDSNPRRRAGPCPACPLGGGHRPARPARGGCGHCGPEGAGWDRFGPEGLLGPRGTPLGRGRVAMESWELRFDTLEALRLSGKGRLSYCSRWEEDEVRARPGNRPRPLGNTNRSSR